MFGEMRIPAENNSLAILIPFESVIKINNADFVFVQKNDSTFERRSVVSGSTQDEMIEIIEGLSENEKVVVKGSFYLKSDLLKEELIEDEH
jgi:multidrug efflux pump subunit AcrA (membrane-fusion protein)